MTHINTSARTMSLEGTQSTFDDLFAIIPNTHAVSAATLTPLDELMQGVKTIPYTAQQQKGSSPFMLMTAQDKKWLRKLFNQLTAISNQKLGVAGDHAVSQSKASFPQGYMGGYRPQTWSAAASGLSSQIHRKDMTVNQSNNLNKLLAQLSAGSGKYSGVNQIKFV